MSMTPEAEAAAAATVTERPRDLPNAAADRQALGLVQALSWHGGLAYRVRRHRHRLVLHPRHHARHHAHHPALARADPQHASSSMLDQTPLHEACHGNIAGKDSNWLWLNHLVGYVCGAILLHEYKAFRYMHLAHHRDTNNPDIDPDHWVAVRWSVQSALALPHHRATGINSISGSTSPSTPTSPACGHSPSTSWPCTRSFMASRFWLSRVRLVARGVDAVDRSRTSSPRR